METEESIPPTLAGTGQITYRIVKKLTLGNIDVIFQPINASQHQDTSSVDVPFSSSSDPFADPDSSSPTEATGAGFPSFHTSHLSFIHLPAIPPPSTLHLGANTKQPNPLVKFTFHPHLSNFEICLQFVASDPPTEVHILSTGHFQRHYRFSTSTGWELAWKGTTTHKGTDIETSGRGNLKLIDEEDEGSGRVLAVFENRTDMDVLGVLSITTGPDGVEVGEGGLLELVVASCIGVVLLERTQSKGWLGGLGKKGKKTHDE